MMKQEQMEVKTNADLKIFISKCGGHVTSLILEHFGHILNIRFQEEEAAVPRPNLLVVLSVSKMFISTWGWGVGEFNPDKDTQT